MLGRYALGRHAIGRTPEPGVYAVEAEAGSFAWAGQDSDGYTLVLIAEAASFAWSGQDSDGYTLVLIAEAASFAWSGQDADLLTKFAVGADAGSFIWTGMWTGMDTDKSQTRLVLRSKGSSSPFVSAASGGGGRLTLRSGRAC